jgi:hypothetical protein
MGWLLSVSTGPGAPRLRADLYAIDHSPGGVLWHCGQPPPRLPAGWNLYPPTGRRNTHWWSAAPHVRRHAFALAAADRRLLCRAQRVSTCPSSGTATEEVTVTTGALNAHGLSCVGVGRYEERATPNSRVRDTDRLARAGDPRLAPVSSAASQVLIVRTALLPDPGPDPLPARLRRRGGGVMSAAAPSSA